MHLPQKALITACDHGDVEAALRSLAAGADVNRPYYGRLPLVAAVEGDHSELLRCLLAPPISADANRTQPDLAGYAALHTACNNDNLEAIELLIAAGANPNLRSAISGRENYAPESDQMFGRVSPVELIGSMATLRHLLSLPGVSVRASLEERDDCGRTALLQACSNHNRSVASVALLLAAGADVHATDDDGRGVLHVVARSHFSDIKRQRRIIELLVKHSKGEGDCQPGSSDSECTPLDINACDGQDCTPLMYAARTGNTSIMKLLLQLGADVSAVDAEDRTALHHFAYMNRPQSQCVDRPSHGPVPGQQNHDPLREDERAREEAAPSHVEAFNMLVAAGADPLPCLGLSRGSSCPPNSAQKMKARRSSILASLAPYLLRLHTFSPATQTIHNTRHKHVSTRSAVPGFRSSAPDHRLCRGRRGICCYAHPGHIR